MLLRITRVMYTLHHSMGQFIVIIGLKKQLASFFFFFSQLCTFVFSSKSFFFHFSFSKCVCLTVTSGTEVFIVLLKELIGCSFILTKHKLSEDFRWDCASKKKKKKKKNFHTLPLIQF